MGAGIVPAPPWLRLALPGWYGVEWSPAPRGWKGDRRPLEHSDILLTRTTVQLRWREILQYDPAIRLLTERLALRPTVPDDVERALDIGANPAVARNLVSATIPPDIQKMTGWFRSHSDEWREGSAYRLAIDLDSRMIGVCDVFDIAEGEGEIGYWTEQAIWGRGFGLEAAERLVRFALEDVGLNKIRAGCTDDNIASAAILTRLGFQPVADVRVFSQSRETEITQRRFQLVV